MKLNGVLPVNKPEGISSFDVIRSLKKKLSLDWNHQKIGHGGTLDVPASGVLLILFGEATKAFDFLLKSDKIYRANFKFGAFTDTDDAKGNIIESFSATPSLQEIESALKSFLGFIEQYPPRLSAVHVDGRRAYEIFYSGVTAKLKPKKVVVKNIKINNYDFKNRLLDLIIECSSGTYIRSLARDLGKKLGCGGYVEHLVRIMSCGIFIEECIDLNTMDIGTIKEKLLPLRRVLKLPLLFFNRDKEWILNGKSLNSQLFFKKNIENGIYQVIHEDSVLAIVEKEGDSFKYLRVFHE